MAYPYQVWNQIIGNQLFTWKLTADGHGLGQVSCLGKGYARRQGEDPKVACLTTG